MCVIAFSPKGINIPTESQIKDMWTQNPDGAGYAYVNKKGKVVYRKGFMKLDDLLKELEAPERFKNTNFAIHFRIGTSGKNDPATCHPFPVSNSFGDLRKTEGESDSVLFHNGVLGKGGIVSPLASDTQDFVVAMSPLLCKLNRSKARDYFIEELVSGSRLLLLYKNNTFKMYGDWKKDGDIWVSNLNYKYSYSWYGTGYYGWNDYYGDYYDDYLATSSKSKKLSPKTINENRLESKEADALWSCIIEKGYKYITDAELDILKRSAEYFTNETITLAGYVLGYDMSQSVAWLEDTPIELDNEDIYTGEEE